MNKFNDFNRIIDIELEREQWRDVAGYEGMYQVSDLGRVRSLKFGKVRVLRARKHTDGYLQVALCKGGKQKNYMIHRLVAQAFITNSDTSKTLINHIDECKQNNRVDNLEYCTAQYNVTYNDIHLRRKQFIHPRYKRDKIKELFNPELSINENIELFRSKGIECSRETVSNLRQDLGIPKYYRPRKNRH